MTDTPQSGVYAAGSYGINAPRGRQIVRIWFCGGKHQPLAHLGNITIQSCAHRSCDDARTCPNRERAT